MWAEAWERLNRAARDVETFNLERKPLVFNVFGLLADAVARLIPIAACVVIIRESG